MARRLCAWLLPVVASLSAPCFLCSPCMHAGPRALVAAVESGGPRRAAEQAEQQAADR